jgi:hypothetical protein
MKQAPSPWRRGPPEHLEGARTSVRSAPGHLPVCLVSVEGALRPPHLDLGLLIMTRRASHYSITRSTRVLLYIGVLGAVPLACTDDVSFSENTGWDWCLLQRERECRREVGHERRFRQWSEFDNRRPRWRCQW